MTDMVCCASPQILERSEGQPYVLANLDSVATDDAMFTTLGSGDNRCGGSGIRG